MSAVTSITQVGRSYRYPVRIVQFGEGNFLRAFWGKAVHELNLSGAYQGQIAVIQPIQRGKIDILKSQDCLYNTSVQDQTNDELTLVESVRKAIDPYRDYEEFLELGRREDLEIIISNTTEAGIVLEPTDSVTSVPPASFPGKLLALLYERYRSFSGDARRGLLIFPCELVERNGDLLKEVLAELARINHLEQAFIDWMVTANTFYNTLVDCIVTGFPVSEMDEFTSRLGYFDNLLVKAEPYRLLVLQGDKEKAVGFPLEKSSLKVVWSDDLTKHRDIKVRIMNGFQTMLSHYGFFCGIESEREAVYHETVGRNMVQGLYTCIVPTLPYGDECMQFADLMLQRLKNPRIEHLLRDINLNSFTKFQTRILPDLLFFRSRGEIPRFLLFSLALVLSYYRIERKDAQGGYYGILGGKSYQVFDRVEYLEILHEIQKEYPEEEYVERVLARSELWRETCPLTAEEICTTGDMMELIRAGHAVDIDLW